MPRPIVPADQAEPFDTEHREERQTTLQEHEHWLNEQGYEVVDPTPEEPPIGYTKQPSMVEHIRSMVQSELLAREALEAGLETFEEANDFEVGDDYDPDSPYEESFDPPSLPEPPAPGATSPGAGEPPAPGAAPGPAPQPVVQPPPAGVQPGPT